MMCLYKRASQYYTSCRDAGSCQRDLPSVLRIDIFLARWMKVQLQCLLYVEGHSVSMFNNNVYDNFADKFEIIFEWHNCRFQILCHETWIDKSNYIFQNRCIQCCLRHCAFPRFIIEYILAINKPPSLVRYRFA